MPKKDTIDLSKVVGLLKAFKELPPHVVQRHKVVPVSITRDVIVVAISQGRKAREKKFAADEIQLVTGKGVEYVYAPQEDIDAVINFLYR